MLNKKPFEIQPAKGGEEPAEAQRLDARSGQGTQPAERLNINSIQTKPQWPHTVDDIVKSLDGIWGLVGATGVNGNLFRLERSLHQPLIYTLTEFKGNEDREILGKHAYQASERDRAINDFARQLGFN